MKLKFIYIAPFKTLSVLSERMFDSLTTTQAALNSWWGLFCMSRLGRKIECSILVVLPLWKTNVIAKSPHAQVQIFLKENQSPSSPICFLWLGFDPWFSESNQRVYEERTRLPPQSTSRFQLQKFRNKQLLNIQFMRLENNID